ncbi:uncharacterized protein LOC120711651 isoform X3 [Panicum virgatum]|nr:uncharacterized protein LOC120672323 isoform X3 [Panicum virgatum]XP_039833076.1 uncharacterized protein LOC120693964 isoform X3 [Panicum virgatum]XP_039853187.1 uncharacterized protein LOC120711651 isoform X3 [Panicum virgatum]
MERRKQKLFEIQSGVEEAESLVFLIIKLLISVLPTDVQSKEKNVVRPSGRLPSETTWDLQSKLDTRTACRRLHVLAVLLACWRSPVMKPGVACLLEIACTRGAACWRATDHLWHGRPAASIDR